MGRQGEWETRRRIGPIGPGNALAPSHFILHNSYFIISPPEVSLIKIFVDTNRLA
jgi:hypothetical protein